MTVTSNVLNGEIDLKNLGVDAPALKRIRATAALELAVHSAGSDAKENVLARAEAYLKFIS